MNMNRPDTTEDVKSKDYTNKSLQKDSNPVTIKASKSPAIESSDQTKAAKLEPLVYRVGKLSFSAHRLSDALYTFSYSFKVTWLQKEENAAVMRLLRRN